MPYFMYITVSEEDRIAIYEMDPDSGDLRHREDVPLEGTPAPLALHPSKRYMYAAQRGINQLSSFAVDQSTGALSLIGEAPLVSDPCYLDVDKRGKYLLSAYYGAGKVMLHSIGDDGALSAAPLQTIDTEPRAHCIRPDPSGKFVFVPHTAPNAIFQFRLDAAAGRLVANAVAKVETPPNTGPRHIFFHPTEPFGYVANEQGSSVTAYRLDRTNMVTCGDRANHGWNRLPPLDSHSLYATNLSMFQFLTSSELCSPSVRPLVSNRSVKSSRS